MSPLKNRSKVYGKNSMQAIHLKYELDTAL